MFCAIKNLIVKSSQMSAITMMLTGCVFGDNQQFFEPAASAVTTALGGANNLTPAPSATPASTPISTPIPSATPTPTATPVGVATPTPTVAPTCTPQPTVAAQAPVAVNDGPYEIPEGSSFTVSDATLMSNDSDPNSLPLSFGSAQTPSVGTVSTSGANIIFTPPSTFVGTATFTYTIQNSAGLTASATVTVDVRTTATLPIYAVSMDSKLYTIDADSNSIVYVATLSLNGQTYSGSACIDGAICEIAITPNGLMYAVDGNHLYQVDTATGVMSLINVQLNGAYELSAMPDGTLIISSSTASVSYNLSTNTITPLPLENWIREGGGDAIALPDGNLYMTIYESSGPDHLLKINPDTGAETDIGGVGYTEVWGLSYGAGTMYGFTGQGTIFTVNQTTGASVLYSNSGIDWATATTNPLLW